MREVLLVVHTGHQSNIDLARQVAGRLAVGGVTTRVLDDEARDLGPSCCTKVVPADDHAAEGTELVLVLGGDGTLLRGAELARPARVPVLGVNLGRVGFLAEADSDALHEAVGHVLERDYFVEERMTLDLIAKVDGEVVVKTWALNEISVEKLIRERILEVVIEVDGRPVSAFGCDGVLCATPTGSTAYAFSAGGPVVWPDVQAILVVPSNAHALFARPLVVSPKSHVAFEIEATGHPAALSADGRRTFELPAGARIEIVEGEVPLKVVRLRHAPFTDRLVEKFDLPVKGWRGPSAG
ncbi:MULTISPECIES: NAD kinase [Lentzea]|uniref:NAD kinase n=1 Tax=Lentzea jiangxiensis TaxID=641025 RepID=A0A1H0UX30_9PSEU|nr:MULTISPECIES: NAD kinase [Lentzea]MCG8924629.1 NAD kinase [Lentzea sp. CC55]SDP70635.1 NAD+ kinase [Lentzea jiangxiensis]SDP98441.1 NAD+ kinase [Lentzea jiangxiensis]